jgi:hypothetical protein
LQKKVTLEEKDHSIIKEMIDTSNSAQSFSFERFNGSGPMKINVYEMSDLELVFCSLNYFYKFDQVVENNILL